MDEATAALLEESARQVAEIRSLYESSLKQQSLPPRLPVLVKNALENQRSALDYLAHRLVVHFGNGKRSQFPLAPNASDWPKRLKEGLPGVADARPDLAAAVEAQQPYQPGKEWLTHLSETVNPLKHRALTPHTRTESVRLEVRGPGGGSVSWDPSSVRFGAGVRIMGGAVDPRTQLPQGVPVQRTVFVDWRFEGTQLSVLGTLELVQRELPRLLAAISTTARW